MSTKTSKSVHVEDESDSSEEEQEMISSDEEKEEPDGDALPPEEPVSDEEEEYQPEEQSDEDEKSEEEEPDDEEEENLFGVDEEDVPAEEDDVAEEEAPVELEGGEDEGRVFEDARKKKPTSRKETKRRLFPFIQKKKRISQVADRESPEYHSLDVRASTQEFFRSSLKIEEKEIIIFEKAIFNASARATLGANLTVDSIEFKRKYLEICRYFIGAYGQMKKSEILGELKQDAWGSKSILFVKARDAEQREYTKIKNPMDVQEDANYKCPKCKGIKAFKRKSQLRGGDEGMSMLLWCADKSCGMHWRING